MDLLLPCQNEISAHLLRSLLLSHGIPSAVVHDNFATMYGNWLTRPHVLISEEALDAGLELLAVPDEPLDETFIEPAETADASEDLGLRRGVPGFIALVLFGCCAGAVLGTADLFLVTLFTMPLKGIRAARVSGLDVLLIPFWWSLYGTVFGILCWPFVALARSCHRRENGSLPLRARLIFFFLPESPLFAIPVLIVFVIIEMLRWLAGAAF